MRIVFRVDSAPQMGGGHLSRCLTLASALKDKGAKCVFVCRDHIGSLVQHVKLAGFDLLTLPRLKDHVVDVGSYSSWVGACWQLDAEQTWQILDKYLSEPIDWIVVDHYGLDEEWERYFDAKGIKVGVIDDLVNRPHSSNFLLDQTCGRTQLEYRPLVCPNTTLLVGESYCLLRKEFFSVREKAIEKRHAISEVTKLLVSFGSTDPQAHTLKALKGLVAFAVFRNIEVLVLVGSACPYIQDIKLLTQTLPYKATLHVDCNQVAELIFEADMAIGAAGVSTWERCFLGLPTLLVKTAENQSDVVNRVISSGAALGYSGNLEDEKELESALIELDAKRACISDFALNMKIGDGFEAVVSILSEA